jgi:hypothetical protein
MFLKMFANNSRNHQGRRVAAARVRRTCLQVEGCEQRQLMSGVPAYPPTVYPAAPQVWQSAMGQTLINQWITMTMSKLNSYNGSADFNAGKTYFINQYGVLNGRNITSVGAPDSFPEYDNNKYWFMWDNQPGLPANGPSGVPSLQYYVNSNMPMMWNENGPIYWAWQSLGGSSGPEGNPTSHAGGDPTSLFGTTGSYQMYQGGTITVITSGPHNGTTAGVYGPIATLYNSMGGSRSYLGFPIANQYAVNGGQRADFEGGYILRSAQGGAVAYKAAPAPTFGNWSASAGLGGTAQDPVVVRNMGGGEEMFVIGGDGAVWHKWQTSPNSSSWSGWFRLGGAAKQITVANNANGTMEVIFIGTDNAVCHIDENTNASWNAPVSLGGYAKQVAVTMNNGNGLELFYVGGDNAIYHQWQTAPNSNNWSNGYSLGGSAKQLTVARNANGLMDVFFIGTDNAVWQINENANYSWTSAASLGGYAKQLTVTMNSANELELFYIGADNAVWHRWESSANSNNWSAESSLGGYAKQLAVAKNANGRLEVFYIGNDNAIWHRWQTSPGGTWSSEASLGGYASQLYVGHMANGALDVFGIDASSNVWHRNQM